MSMTYIGASKVHTLHKAKVDNQCRWHVAVVHFLQHVSHLRHRGKHQTVTQATNKNHNTEVRQPTKQDIDLLAAKSDDGDRLVSVWIRPVGLVLLSLKQAVLVKKWSFVAEKRS
jgi:hypothetical protein